jgi:hypothetical protein
MSYDYIDQSIVATCLIQAHDNDSFYNPIPLQHTGFAFNGFHYTLGVQDGMSSPWVSNGGNLQASWWTETQTGNEFRGDQQNFPTYGLVLLSTVSMVILDQSTPVAEATALPLWMQFLIGDSNALANDFDGAIQGFTPSGVCYADGIISVTYYPDQGNQAAYVFPEWDPTISYTAGQIVTFNGLRYKAVDYGSPPEPPVAGIPPAFNLNFWVVQITQPYPAPYPAIGVTSHMVVSFDFAKDSVYLDVAV